jgi:hypothetical protein
VMPLPCLHKREPKRAFKQHGHPRAELLSTL